MAVHLKQQDKSAFTNYFAKNYLYKKHDNNNSISIIMPTLLAYLQDPYLEIPFPPTCSGDTVHNACCESVPLGLPY